MKTKNKIQTTYIDASKFETLLSRKGFIFLDKGAPIPEGHTGGVCRIHKGFVQVCGPVGRNLYIAKTKRVGRVDIALGQEIESPGLINLGDDKFGAVLQQLNMTGPEDEVMQNFELVLDHMLTMDPRVSEKKAKATKEKEAGAKGFSFVTPTERKASKALLEKVAKEMGAQVSPNA